MKFPKFVKKAFKKTRIQVSFDANPYFWDWKSWFNGQIRSIKNLNAFRAFLFKQDPFGNPVFFYKKTIRDMAWLGFDGTSEGLCN